MNDHELFELGDVVLQEGATLRDAKLAYKTYGTLNGDKSNAIVYPTWYSAHQKIPASSLASSVVRASAAFHCSQTAMSMSPKSTA